MTNPPSAPRYLPLSAHYRRRFGHRVYKLSVSTAQSCPNREGQGGMEVCSFCDEWGSAAYHQWAGQPLADQVAAARERVAARYKAERFLVYFQAYTNTFERFSRLQALVEEALALPDVVGVVVGTRPDCLPRRVLDFFAGVARERYLSVELGVQTLDDGQLQFLSRGHDRACSLRALERLRAYPEIEVCAHLMFGIPGESDGQLRETAGILSAAGVHGVKLHNLHVLRNTPLERLYAAGGFEPIALSAYARRVAVFLEHLAPWVAVHRLNAVASRWEDVVAPDWVRYKMGPTQFIRDYLERVDTWQGRCYEQPGPALPSHGAVQGAPPNLASHGARWG